MRLNRLLILIIVLIVLTGLFHSSCQPYNTFIVVKNARGEVITHLVDVLVEGEIRRINVTHFATYIKNTTKLVVVKDGVVVYEMNLTPPENYQLVEVRARVQHLTLHFEGLTKEVLVTVKYSDVSISRYAMHSLEIRNVPYPVNLTISIPYARYSETVLYNGEEVITVVIREPKYNVYLRFCDALLRPLPTSLINVTLPPHFINETCIGYKLNLQQRVSFSVYGVKVGELTLVPPRDRFDVKVIDVKLQVGPLKVIAPPGTVIEVVLPSGKKFVKNCTVGEVQFDNVPTCKLLLTAKKGNLRSEKSIDFPGVLTVTVGFEQPLVAKLTPLLSYLPYIALVSVAAVMLAVAVKALRRPPKPRPRVEVVKKVGVRRRVKIPNTTRRVEIGTPKVVEGSKIKRGKTRVEAIEVKTPIKPKVKEAVDKEVKEVKPKVEEEKRVKPRQTAKPIEVPPPPELPPPPPPEWLATLKELKEIKELEIPQDIFSKPEEFKGDLSKILKKRRKFKSRKRRT